MNAEKNIDASLQKSILSGAKDHRRSNLHKRRIFYWLMVVIFAAFALRMFRVSDLLMWGDEGFSVFSSSRDLLTIARDTTTIDPHPPLYYFLLHFYFLLVGQSELAIRFFSVFFGTATVAVAWSIGKRMFNVRAGVFATLIAMLAPFAVHYSQEVRMYALAMFWVALGLYFFTRLFASHDPKKNWLGYALTMFLALYTLYHTALIFLAMGLALLPLYKTHRTFVIRWFVVSFGIVATFIPWLAFRYASAFTGIKDVAGETQPMDLWTFLARGFAAVSVGTTLPISSAFQLAGLIALAIMLALILALVKRAANFHDALLLLLTGVPIVAYYPLYLALPLYRGRLFALACIPFVLLFARGMAMVAQYSRLLVIPMGLLIVGSSAYSLNNYYFSYNRYSAVVEDYLPAIHEIEQRAQPGDLVLFHAYWHQGYFLSHYRGAPLEYRALENQNDLNVAVSKPRNVWAIVQALAHHPAEDWLAQNAFVLGEEKYGQMRVLSYRTGAPASGENYVTPVLLDNGMQLYAYRINGDAPILVGHDRVHLQLDWGVAQKITADYTVSVRITNPDGEIIWAQQDVLPANGTLPTSSWQPGQIVSDRHALMIPPGIPPGTYAATVVVYDSKTGRVANVLAPENLRGQNIKSGTITLAKSAELSPAITPNNPITAQWNEIALTGFDLATHEANAGNALPLTLYWRATQRPAQDYLAEFKLVDATGAVRAALRFKPANGYPTRFWLAGETWLDKPALVVPAETMPGTAKIFVNVLDESGNPVASAVELTRVDIGARVRRFDLPSPKSAMEATFGNKIKLLGYDLDKPSRVLTLYWQALGSMRERYTVFVHLLDAQDNIVAQIDSEPQAGNAPTTSWLKGEVIQDTYQIHLPLNLAPGDYSLMIGLYDAASGARLSIDANKADRVPLTKINLAP